MSDEQVSSSVEEDVNTDEVNDVVEPSFLDGKLSFVGGDAVTIPEQVFQYAQSTRKLDLSYNCLRDVNGVERFTGLEELVLDNNKIDDDVKFPVLSKLETLTLNKNHITNLDQLLNNLQNNLPSLRYLSLLSNIACPNQLSALDKDEEDYQRYRYFVLYRLPNLKFLDSSQVRPEELVEAKRVGPFMKTVKATASEITDNTEMEDSKEEPTFSPLPPTTRAAEKHIGSYGKSKYVYYGKHSEGNRFIRNNDL